MLGQDTEGTAERRNVHLPDVGGIVKDLVGGGQREGHLVGVAARLHGTQGRSDRAGQAGGASQCEGHYSVVGKIPGEKQKIM